MRENPENNAAIQEALIRGYISAIPHTGEIFSHRHRGSWRKEPRILSVRPKSNGYLRSTITVDECEYNVFHHRIIWIAVNGSIPAGKCIDHINGVKSDNRISNLRTLTKSQNVKAAFGQGLRFGKSLDDEEKDQIRILLSQGDLSQSAIAEIFGCDQTTVSRIKLGKC